MYVETAHISELGTKNKKYRQKFFGSNFPKKELTGNKEHRTTSFHPTDSLHTISMIHPYNTKKHPPEIIQRNVNKIFN